MQKRGQITVFIILGIVIVISVGLLLLNVKTEFSPVRYDTKVKDYVTNCLKQVSDEGIYLIGRQGGVLYDDQIGKGSILSKFGNEFVLNYNGYNVSYGIKKIDTDNGTYMLKPLCNKEEKNKWNLSDYMYSCETYDLFDLGQNIQDYLQEYIKENITKNQCNLKYLENELGYKIINGSVDVSVLFGDDDINIELEYPLTIDMKNSRAELKKFSYNPKIRLKRMHELASHLIGFDDLEGYVKSSGDIIDPEFDIVNDAGRESLKCKKRPLNVFGSCFLEGMEVKKIKNVNGKDDILVISDNKSILNGNYIFQFVVENRRPYFEPITVESYNVDDIINIKLKAHDFDEDSLIASYMGCNDKLNEMELNIVGFNEYVFKAIAKESCKLTFQVCDDGNSCNNIEVDINV